MSWRREQFLGDALAFSAPWNLEVDAAICQKRRVANVKLEVFLFV